MNNELIHAHKSKKLIQALLSENRLFLFGPFL